MSGSRIPASVIRLPLLLLLLSGCSAHRGEIDIIYSATVRGASSPDLLNTVEGTYTRDMVMDPPLTVRLQLTLEERERIYLEAKEFGFFELPERIIVRSSSGMTPCQEFSLEIRSERESHRVKWDTCRGEELNALRELRSLLDVMIMAKDEYKQLPKPRGAYL